MGLGMEHLAGIVIAGVSIAAFARAGRNGYVKKETCGAIHEGIKQEFASLRTHLDTRIDDLRILIKQSRRD